MCQIQVDIQLKTWVPIPAQDDEVICNICVQKSPSIIVLLALLQSRCYPKGHESMLYEADNSVVGPFFKIYYVNLKGPNKH